MKDKNFYREQTSTIFSRKISYLLFLTIFFLSIGCSLPPVDRQNDLQSLPVETVQQTTLGQAVHAYTLAHPGLSGIYTLDDAHDAFAARILLARAAEKTLDVQYYIWHRDITGTLLLYELHQAAERGVRVRLLLDDNGISGMDDWLAALHNHPNIQVRLFNPYSFRKAKFLGFVTHFSRANRRMHNKSFTADQQLTIAGGRNIGDEYFAATNDLLFADLDVIAAGPAAQKISEDFDRYWSSQSAYPVDVLFQQKIPAESLIRQAQLIIDRPEAVEYIEAIRQANFTQALINETLVLEWAQTKLISDNPAKGLGLAENSDLMIHNLTELLGEPQTSLFLVSPYFVPTRAGVDVFSQMAEQGIQVHILTNALEATDVAAVHSGYAKRRKALLKSGVYLYEMRRNPQAPETVKVGTFGSSGSSLHAKTFALDGQRVFVGSFNFDPRSANLNTELGFVIDSPIMAEEMERVFTHQVPLASYQVKLDEQGHLYWLEYHPNEPVIYQREPNTSWMKRAMVTFLSWLPIEWLL